MTSEGSGTAGTEATFAGLEAHLREQLGPDAVLGELVFDGRIVHLRGARVPLGDATRATIVIEQATAELGAGLPLGPLPLAARLVSLRAHIRVGELVVPITVDALEDDGASWVRAVVRVGGHVSGHVGVDALLVVSPSRWTLAGGTLTAEGSVTPPTFAGLRATGLPLGSLPGAPADLVATGTVKPSPEGGLVVQLELATARLTAAFEARIDRSARGLGIADARVTAEGARITGSGIIPIGAPMPREARTPMASLRIAKARAPLLAAIGALVGATIPIANDEEPGLPSDLELSGELVIGGELDLTGSLALETPRSAVTLSVQTTNAGARGASLGAASLLGSTLRGRLTAADATTLGLFPRAVHPRPDEILRVDARLTGTLARPGLAGRVTAARLVMEGEGVPKFTLGDVFALLDLGPLGLAWPRVSGRVLGGSFTSSGRLERMGALASTLAWEGVRVEELPIAGGAVGEVLQGSCAGEVRFERASGASAPSVRGELTIAEPAYVFTKDLAPRLERYKLPPIPARGSGPLRAAIRLTRGELSIDPIAARLDGIDLDGSLTLGARGGVRGRFLVRLGEGYLAKSPLLAIPAATGSGSVVIPVYVRGTRGAPTVTTNAIEILDALLSRSRAGSAVKHALDGLRTPRARDGIRRGKP